MLSWLRIRWNRLTLLEKRRPSACLRKEWCFLRVQRSLVAKRKRKQTTKIEDMSKDRDQELPFDMVRILTCCNLPQISPQFWPLMWSPPSSRPRRSPPPTITFTMVQNIVPGREMVKQFFILCPLQDKSNSNTWTTCIQCTPAQTDCPTKAWRRKLLWYICSFSWI